MHPAIAQHRPDITAICQRYGIRRLEVFGSAARATDFDPDRSDADFLMEFAQGSKRPVHGKGAVLAWPDHHHKEWAMTAMNVVHMRVKPGKEEDYVRLHQEMDIRSMPGGRNFWLIRSGERSFVVVGEWDSLEAMANARPAMVANLDKLRPLLEDLGGGRGLTEPWSGEVALHLKP